MAIWQCDTCGASFEEHEGLAAHEQRAHGAAPRPSGGPARRPREVEERKPKDEDGPSPERPRHRE